MQVQCISAKVGRMIDLGSIYIKGNVTSEKFLPGSQQNLQPLDLHRTIEYGGHKAVRI